MTRIDSVSVIVPHYGDPMHARALLAQIKAQSSARILEVVVVDDASPTPFPVEPGARVIRRAANGGFGAAVNTAAAVASGSHLLVLNSDLAIGAFFVDELCAAAEPWQPAVCGPMLLGPDGTSQWAGRRFPRARHYVTEWLTPLARFRPALHAAVGHDTRCVAGAVVPVDWVVGAALLIPADAFRDSGGFDEGFHMNCEEVDLQRRLHAAGVPSVFLGTVAAAHAGGGSSDSAQRRRWVAQARFRYARKWGEGPRRLKLALRMASAANLAHNAARRAAGRPVAPIDEFRRELSYLRDGGRA